MTDGTEPSLSPSVNAQSSDAQFLNEQALSEKALNSQTLNHQVLNPEPWVVGDTTPCLEPPKDMMDVVLAGDRLKIFLPPTPDWLDLWPQLHLRLEGQERLWQDPIPVHLYLSDRPLEVEHFTLLTGVFTALAMDLTQVYTQNRDTAIVAATLGYSVIQSAAESDAVKTENTEHDRESDDCKPDLPPPPLYLETTLRSGTELRHHGSIVIVGDVNPGSTIIADGNILVWGRLRGIAHAGANGNLGARIMTLNMAATQLRIAHLVARTPDPPSQAYPEVAYALNGNIQIAPAWPLPRSRVSKLSNQP